jgi:hypothetical protein
VTSIELFGVRVDEPVGVATDLLVSAVCLYAYFRLKNEGRTGWVHRYFRLYFFWMGVATCLGGIIGHGFLYALSFEWKLPGWIISMFAVAMIERSSIETAKPLINPKTGQFFLTLNVIELAATLIVTMVTLNFKWVELHSAYGLLGVVFPFHLYTYIKTKDKGSLTILTAVGITAIAAVVFIKRLSFGEWFNHLDISHMVMAVGAWVFYRGAILLRD